jgi:hypothetical protein
MDIIKMDFKGTVCDDVDWQIHLAQYGIKLRALVNAVLHFRVP